MVLSIVKLIRRKVHLTLEFAAGLAIFLALASAHIAQAQIVIGSSSGSVPGYTGTGLAGTYYNFGVTSQPLATFTTTNICFPDCQSTSFSDGAGGLLAFTNGNIAIVAFNPSFVPPNYWNGSTLDISGYLAITTPGTYNFALGSDDSSHLTIGGQDILDINNCCTTVNGSATFNAAGLYAIVVQFMEGGGNSYLNLSATDSNGSCFLGCSNGDGGYTQPGLFYSDAQLQGAPAPAVGSGWVSIVVLLLVSAGASVRRWRHGAAI